jgi:DNA invertase Pin-like site-specific DNA recombinase
VTGAHSDRRQLLKLLDTLAPGDVVTVTRIDRLARSTFDLFGLSVVHALSRMRRERRSYLHLVQPIGRQCCIGRAD